MICKICRYLLFSDRRRETLEKAITGQGVLQRYTVSTGLVCGSSPDVLRKKDVDDTASYL